MTRIESCLRSQTPSSFLSSLAINIQRRSVECTIIFFQFARPLVAAGFNKRLRHSVRPEGEAVKVSTQFSVEDGWKPKPYWISHGNKDDPLSESYTSMHPCAHDSAREGLWLCDWRS